MIEEEKIIKYVMYLCKREILEQKKKLICLKNRLNSLNENKTRTRKLNNKKNKS